MKGQMRADLESAIDRVVMMARDATKLKMPVMPTFIVGTGTDMVAMTVPEYSDAKPITHAAIRKKLRDGAYEWYAFVFEAWVTKVPGAGRQSAVIVGGVARDAQDAPLLRTFIQDELALKEEEPMVEAVGPLLDLFRPMN